MYCVGDQCQWDNFIKHHAGSWAGLQIQTSYEDEDKYQDDPFNAPVKLLCGTSLLPNQIDGSVSHINFFVNQEVDYRDSESIPSSSIVSREVGVYTQEGSSSLPSKVCSTVLLGGPSCTANALSIQFSFSHQESLRCRVLLSFESSSTVFIPNTSIQVPNAVALDTVTISREKRVSDDLKSFPAPSEFVDLNSPIWREVEIDSDEFKGKISLCSKSVYNESVVVSPSSDDNIYNDDDNLGLIRSYLENQKREEDFFSPKAIIGNTRDNKENDDENIPRFIKAYRGGIVIDSPLAINAGVNSCVSVYWSMPKDNVLYKATATFSAMNDAVNNLKRRKKVDESIDQPALNKFYVETFSFV